ncbi:protein-disulfide reductase DsbD [Pelodictyon phaeoclathratiforme]|jgi:thiol:disulfide interchange protein DsbD|uniref:Thiol:disulfide interchange protein DsbD n=1 Tax=Pelodictyon phaeoclathratiforme (strain DSM 5477 / BU-1) TaxID=324925 RepID=B4SGI9_PELPB|nr:protein-disulfide reductase DsbD [Pelodictyon phaeoclathratiforme]ACF44925.1 Protein-disulfide reductase [Pelodictyon phaeoclathratiforme BU-1]
MRKTKMSHYALRRTVAILGLFLVLFLRVSTVFAAEFLDPEQAFRITAELNSARSVVLHWDIAKGYKLYRDQVAVSVESGKAELKAPLLPKAIMITDPSTNEKIAIYHDMLHVEVPLVKADGPFVLNVVYQGCAEDGLCYPPITKLFKVDPARPGLLSLAGEEAVADPVDNGSADTRNTVDSAPAAQSAASASAKASIKDNDLSLATATLAGGSLWKIALAFLAFGLLLSFTPCVLPMVPILSSIIVGEGDVTRRRSFLMALAYCLGMALVYTSLGVAAGLAGEGLAGALQKPWVLVMFALLLVLLSLSMFDVYQLQLPVSLQSKLGKASGGLKRGRFVGVFFMGALSALIVGPCVAAPLAGTLVYISQTRDVLLGGLALFSMAMGMSVPLLLVGLSAGSLLPKAGAWMIGVKYVFGLLLIAVAIWMVSPILPASAVMLFWGAFALLCSVFLGLFDASSAKPTIADRFGKTFGLVLFVIGLLEIVGAAAGGTNVLEPLSQLQGASSASSGEEKSVGFTRIRTVAELDQALLSAKKPVMLDFYADWCVACKEMDRFTFHDPKVIEQLGNLTLLQVNVTANSEDDRALMKRFGLFGPPGMIFFDTKGNEIADSRIVGVLEARAFFDHLNKFVMSH